MAFEFKVCPKCQAHLELQAGRCPVCGWSSRESVAGPIVTIIAVLLLMLLVPLICCGVCFWGPPIAYISVVYIGAWWFWIGLFCFLGGVAGLEYWRRKSK
jgi:hypothetical protein